MKDYKERPIISNFSERNYSKIHYYVIRTMEEEPRYIETVSRWNGQVDYSLVYNINYGKVYKGTVPPYRSADEFEKRTGIDCCFQEVDKKAFDHYKKYEEYYNGTRELTMQEKIEQKEELDKWRSEKFPLEKDTNNKFLKKIC